MKTRIIAAAVLLPVFLALLLAAPPIILTLAISVIGTLAAHELFKAVNGTCKKTPAKRTAVYASIGAVMIPFVVYVRNTFDIMMLAGELPVIFIILCLLAVDFLLNYKTDKIIRARQYIALPAAALVIPYMLSCIIALRLMDGGRFLVMLPVIVSVITDSGAYFTGKAIGKHRPLPKISPNKTTEGFIGGLLTGIIGLAAYGFIINAVSQDISVNIVIIAIYGLIGAAATEIGDLTFSLIKRKCGIKDYGSLIPGHGGVLDRIDSMIVSIPMMYILVLLLPVINIL